MQMHSIQQGEQMMFSTHEKNDTVRPNQKSQRCVSFVPMICPTRIANNDFFTCEENDTPNQKSQRCVSASTNRTLDTCKALPRCYYNPVK